MGEEIDRMIGHKKRAILFFVLLVVSIGLIVGFLIIMGTSDYNGSNSDFAQLEARGEIQTKTYHSDEFNAIQIFYDGFRSERTLFNDVLPNLKIVNSNDYRVEVRTNSELLELLDIVNDENRLAISFKSQCYNDVVANGKEYKGLYVNCDVFDVTVYAPVSQLYTSAELNLDYQSPKTKLLKISAIGELNGKVYGIDAERLECLVNGATVLELEGNVGRESVIIANHNSKIYAESLYTPLVSTGVSSQIFGLSYIKGNGYSQYSFFSLGYVVSWGLVLSVVAMAGLFVLFLVKYLKLKKKIDETIEEIEKKSKFLTPKSIVTENNSKNGDDDSEKNSANLKKTDENLLQNEE